MSQVRGRIKTVVNYDDQITVTGTCCAADGTKSVKTFDKCSAEGGRWVPVLPVELVECPQLSEKGCCCSCAYTTKNTGTPEDWAHPDHGENLVGGRFSSSNGTKGNVSRCECDYNNGNFLLGDCPEPGTSIATLCETDGVEGRDDVRWPFSCCHCDTDADGYLFRNCSNVCNSAECLEFTQAYSDNPDCASEFDPFKICDYRFNGDPKECADLAIPGCTDPAASNYDPAATSDDGSCEYVILGCTDPLAINFNPQATEDDGSCEYDSGSTGPTGPTGPDGPTGADPVGACCSNDLNSWPYDPDNYPGDFQRCTEKTESECELSLGTWQGAGTDCSEPFVCDCFFPFEDTWEGDSDIDGDGVIDPVVGGILWRDCNNQCTPEGPSVRSATYGGIKVVKDRPAPTSACQYNFWDQAETQATVTFDAKYAQGENVLGYQKAVECREICAEGETHPKWIEATNTVNCDDVVSLNFMSMVNRLFDPSDPAPTSYSDCVEEYWSHLNRENVDSRTRFVNVPIDIHPDTKSLVRPIVSDSRYTPTLIDLLFFKEPPEGDDVTVTTPPADTLPEGPTWFGSNNEDEIFDRLEWWRSNNTVYNKWTEPVIDPWFTVYPYQNPTNHPLYPTASGPSSQCDYAFIDYLDSYRRFDVSLGTLYRGDEFDRNPSSFLPETRNWYYGVFSNPYQYPYLAGTSQFESAGIPSFFDNEIITRLPFDSIIPNQSVSGIGGTVLHLQRIIPIPSAFSPYTSGHQFSNVINRGNYSEFLYSCSEVPPPPDDPVNFGQDSDQVPFNASNGYYSSGGLSTFRPSFVYQGSAGTDYYPSFFTNPMDVDFSIPGPHPIATSFNQRRHQLDYQYFTGYRGGGQGFQCFSANSRSGRYRRDASGGWCGGCLNGKSAIPLRIYEPCRIKGTMGYHSQVYSGPSIEDSYGPKNWKQGLGRFGTGTFPNDSREFTYEEIKPRTLKCWKKCMQPNSLLNTGRLSDNFESFMDTDPLDTDLNDGYNFVYEPDPDNNDFNFKLHVWCGKPPTDDDGGDSPSFGGFNSVLKQFRNYRVTKIGYDRNLCNIFPESHQHYGIYAPFYNYNPLFISMITDGPAKPGFHINGFYPADYNLSRTPPNQGGNWFWHGGQIFSQSHSQWWDQLGFTDPNQPWNMDVNIFNQSGDNSLYEDHRFDWYTTTSPVVPGKRPKSMCLASDFYPRTYTTPFELQLPESSTPDPTTYDPDWFSYNFYTVTPGGPGNNTQLFRGYHNNSFCNPFAPITPPAPPDENYTNPDAGACCIYDRRENKFKCEYKGRGSCENQNGFFSLDKDGNAKNCRYVSCPKAPVMSGGFANPPSIKESELPEVGELFAGGIYLGVFDPRSSLTRSRIETGSSEIPTVISALGEGQKFRKWALIAAPADIGREMGGEKAISIPFQNNSEKIKNFTSSTFDGHFNTFGNNAGINVPKTDLFNKIREYYLYSFRDWYLPSVQELGFMIHQQKDMDIGVSANRYSQNQRKLDVSVAYLSSSTKQTEETAETQKYQTANLVYHILSKNSINSEVFTTLASRTAPAKVRLFRRIYIEE